MNKGTVTAAAPVVEHFRLNMVYCSCGARWTEHLSGGRPPYPPTLMCRCGHGGRHHRQGDVESDRRSCMALGFHGGIADYDGSECYQFEPIPADENLVTFRRGTNGRFQRVPG